MNDTIKKLVRASGCNTKRAVRGVSMYTKLDSDFEKYTKTILEEFLKKVEPYIDEFIFKDVEIEIKDHFGIRDEE